MGVFYEYLMILKLILFYMSLKLFTDNWLAIYNKVIKEKTIIDDKKKIRVGYNVVFPNSMFMMRWIDEGKDLGFIKDGWNKDEYWVNV